MTQSGGRIGETAEEVLDIIREMPDGALERLLDAWNEGRETTKHNLEEITGVSGEKTGSLARLVAEPRVSMDMLHAMLATGLKARSRSSAGENRVEMVWTGPSRISLGIRNTHPVIDEMLESATPEERITIVGYRITRGAGKILDRLNACLRSGVKVNIIMDRNRANLHEIDRCFPGKSLVRPTIYTRMGKEHKFYKVHAKVIIIGNRQALVSSANLTGLGTAVNFEIGLLVNGPVVEIMQSVIQRMISEEYFVRCREA